MNYIGVGEIYIVFKKLFPRFTENVIKLLLINNFCLFVLLVCWVFLALHYQEDHPYSESM